MEIDKLKVGDIILIRSNSRISEMVRRLTNSQYSHAILYVGVSSMIDSDGYGVQSNNIQRLLIDDPENAVVLRLKRRGTVQEMFNVETFARQKIGTEYSTEEAKIAAVTKDIEAKNPNRQFCTRFVAQAYDNAGFKLVQNPDYCTPEDLLNSDLLERVPDMLRIASEKELEFANSENPLEKQRDIHNSIFQKARELTGRDIQTFEQLGQVIIEMPEIDQEITNFVRDSGFLTMTEGDIEKNPWHYDAKKMIEHYKHPEQLFEVAKFYATTEEKTRERLILTLNSLKQANKVIPREYFKMEIELYQKLIQFSLQRQTEAMKVLKYS
ncbi:YiiX/YebB-like N1pC/P60 family cysteine hydrolase [Adhaeribacter terreus]|uniref:YiiX/YebB-like N1pC/P60 family cysteine hydrolase n=1 Tax=Adhaeribacter terreus TaxID=529703 RepID=A0ABW0EDT4_9BACT